MTPLVSVILPTYNRAYLLPRAIQSVLDQQYENLELIIVDDGSTDETAAVVVSNADPRIRYVRFEQNRGIGAARHKGVRSARGELIAFIDSDDIWLPGKLERQMHLFETYPHLDFIFGNYVNINHLMGTQELGINTTRMQLDGMVINQLEDKVWEILSGYQKATLGYSFMALPTVMFRAKLIEVAGNFEPSLSGPEDFEYWWRLAAHGVRMAFTEQPLIERHKDAQSITSQTLHFAPHYLRALTLCEQTSRQHGQHEILPALRQAKHRTWCGLIRAHALRGERQKALRGFAQSLRYGVSGQAFIFAAAALAGPDAIDRAKRMRRAFTAGEPTT